MLAPEWRTSARSTCPKCIARRGDGSHLKSATGWREKTSRAMMLRNHKVCGRRFRPAAKRAGPEHKNKTETKSASVRSDLESNRPIADDPEWNRAFRYRSTDQQGRLDRFAN